MRKLYQASQLLADAVTKVVGCEKFKIPTFDDVGHEWVTLPAGSKMMVFQLDDESDEIVIKHVPYSGNKIDIASYERDSNRLALAIKNLEAERGD